MWIFLWPWCCLARASSLHINSNRAESRTVTSQLHKRSFITHLHDDNPINLSQHNRPPLPRTRVPIPSPLSPFDPTNLPATSVYSAYEHTAILASSAESPTHATDAITAATASASLPIDITIETLLSVLLLCAGVVLSAPALRPIQWRVWAGEVEREGRRGGEKAALEGVVNPFVGLEERPGFVDIRVSVLALEKGWGVEEGFGMGNGRAECANGLQAKRKEFADWVREGGSSERKS